ncbi:hypothetical protein [uncultured Flavobacterium sp.]|uniref:hypothetical protein n=1 Tax=uncultured Flavobacterium sp. TaxID=165435 RepID=UPI00292F4C66|nr:hypothetical protein [uncultured Flavobacterium sp.]
MKNKLIFLILLLCSCTNKDELNGYVYDYDTELPLKNVYIVINDNKTQTDSTGFFCMNINLTSGCKIVLKKEGYTAKEIYRNPDSLGKFSKRSLKYNRFYMYNKESDFSK